jgi:hypothetical protein
VLKDSKKKERRLMKIKMKALRQHGGGMEIDEDLGMALEGTFMQDEVQNEEGDL